MYLVIPNLKDSLLIFFSWEDALSEAEKMASHFYYCGFDVQRKVPSKEECHQKGVTVYAVYQDTLHITIQKVVMK